jgi:anti-anti-sigma factor
MRGDMTRGRLKVDQIGPVAVARVAYLEELRESEVQALGDQLLRLVDKGCCQIILDLGGVTAVSSSVLGKILALYKRAKYEGGRLVLCGVSGRLRESLDALQLTRLIQTFEDCQKAVDALTPVA